MTNKFKTREEWLGFVTTELRPVFKAAGFPIQREVRFSVGFTSAGYKSKAIGECWDSKASTDKHSEIFIKPTEDNPVMVAGILAHELVHAAVGVKEGHKGKFRAACRALGFTKKMQSALPDTDMQRKVMDPILKRAGKLPHKKLNAMVTSRKKQGTRLLKAECETCSYTVRVTSKWLQEAGAPHCGVKSHGRMVCADFEDGGEGEE